MSCCAPCVGSSVESISRMIVSGSALNESTYSFSKRKSSARTVRQSTSFSYRESVGCEDRPPSSFGRRLHAVFRSGSWRRVSASLQSSYASAVRKAATSVPAVSPFCSRQEATGFSADCSQNFGRDAGEPARDGSERPCPLPVHREDSSQTTTRCRDDRRPRAAIKHLRHSTIRVRRKRHPLVDPDGIQASVA